MEEDLYSSEAWKNATPHQRREFISKLRASKKIEKDLKAKKERKKEIDSRPAPAPSKRAQRKKEKRIAARDRKKRKLEFLVNVPAKKPVAIQKPVLVAGIDVTTTEFLSTYEWRKVRMQALKKYGPKCMCCGATPATGAVMNVDHIKPRKLFPSLALDVNNLQILCHDCNHGKGNWDQTDWRKQK